MTPATRRSFLTGIAGVIAAPAIVRASSLMAIKPIKEAGNFVMVHEGQITEVVISSAGSGYSSMPLFTFSNGLPEKIEFRFIQDSGILRSMQ